MDTFQQVAIIPKDKETSVAGQRQRRSIAEKRRIVEETLVEGASVARVARAHGINANQVFGWRRLYLAGRLGEWGLAQICFFVWRGHKRLPQLSCRWKAGYHGPRPLCL